MTSLPISSKDHSFELNGKPVQSSVTGFHVKSVFVVGLPKNFCLVGRDLTAFRTNLSGYPGEMELIET